MDVLIRSLDLASLVRVTYVDVTVAAKALEARHLSGPTAGLALAEALVAAALLTGDASEDEALTIQLNVGGPLRGLVVDGRGDGSLRGYTHAKVLNDLDGGPAIDTAEALGASGMAQVTRTRPGRVISQTPVRVDPPRMRTLLVRYLLASVQVAAAAEIAARSDSGGLIVARGLLAERMPDGSSEAFLGVAERFGDGRVRAALAAEHPAARLPETLGLQDLSTRDSRVLCFRCGCSGAKARSVLDVLSDAELREVVAGGGGQRVICHMCGQVHTVASTDVAALLRQRDLSGTARESAP